MLQSVPSATRARRRYRGYMPFRRPACINGAPPVGARSPQCHTESHGRAHASRSPAGGRFDRVACREHPPDRPHQSAGRRRAAGNARFQDYRRPSQYCPPSLLRRRDSLRSQYEMCCEEPQGIAHKANQPELLLDLFDADPLTWSLSEVDLYLFDTDPPTACKRDGAIAERILKLS